MKSAGCTKHKERQETESWWRSDREMQGRNIRELKTVRGKGGEEGDRGVTHADRRYP